MNCQEVQQVLLDNTRAGDDRQEAEEVLRHLESCDVCRQADRQYQQLRSLLSFDGAEAVPTDGYPAFTRRLLRRHRRQVHRQRRWYVLRRLGGAAAALAASMLLGFWLGARHNPAPGLAEGPGPAAAPGGNGDGARIRWTPAEVARQVGVFEQVQQLFDQRAKWLMVANGSSDLGIAQEPVAATDKVLLLRLTMLHDKAVVSQADLAIVPGQTARLKVPLGKDRELRYEVGTTAYEPTHLSLWVEMQSPPGGETLAALATNLQVEPDARASVGHLMTASGTYELRIAFSRAARRGKP